MDPGSCPAVNQKNFTDCSYGGVLDVGYSEKDLDLLFVVQNPEICNVESCLHEIAALEKVVHRGSTHEVADGYCAVIRIQNGDHKDAEFRACA